MIQGFATIEGTWAYAAKHTDIAFATLGGTGLQVSQAGFGCYRVSVGVAEHEAAMRFALQSGINLIDTSTNYVDGDSERLVGQVLSAVVDNGELSRDQVVVVSKAGYLQGRNYTLSQKRKQQGKGFEELVDLGKDLEHCIHPDFLEDQLTRSLQRLNLEVLDIFLLHNPEYYLSWAQKQKMELAAAREIYYQRLRNAFLHLEKEVERGRIRWYGVSSNTFGKDSQAYDFTSLDALYDLSRALSGCNHFTVAQLPLNLLEPGAVLNSNQADGKSVLGLAHNANIGVLINRPLNAIGEKQLFRLAEIKMDKTYADDEIIQALGEFRKSEKSFVKQLLPSLDVPVPLRQRIKEQLCVSDTLKFYWRNFGNYERWRQTKSGFFLPRVQGVLQFLAQHREDVDGLGAWMDQHSEYLGQVLAAVESIYAGDARRQVQAMRRRLRASDQTWGEGETLSQMAVRAVRSNLGVSCVLVGMRRSAYVEDILAELRRPVQQENRITAWSNLTAANQQDS